MIHFEPTLLIMPFFPPFTWLWAASQTLGLLGLSVVLWPIISILVRVCAHYNPERIRPSIPNTSSYKPGFLETTKRVYQMEGMAGFYKGLGPGVLSCTLGAWIPIILNLIPFGLAGPGNLGTSRLQILCALLLIVSGLIIFTPLTIISLRAITTHYRLSYLLPQKSFYAITTSTERRNLSALYVLNVMEAQTYYLASITLFAGLIRRFTDNAPLLLVPDWLGRHKAWTEVTFFCLILASNIVVVTPLQVVMIRLAIQQDPSEDDDETHLPTYAFSPFTVDSHVIELRYCAKPYGGVLKCIRTIVQEEGPSSLYRGWWATGLLGCGIVFASAL